MNGLLLGLAVGNAEGPLGDFVGCLLGFAVGEMLYNGKCK